METDIWGQLALEASSVYLTDGDGTAQSGPKRNPFRHTVLHEHTNTSSAYHSKQFSRLWKVDLIICFSLFLSRRLISCLIEFC